MTVVTERRALAVCVVMVAALLSSCSAGRLPAADRCNPAVGAALAPAPVAFAPPLPADPTASPASALRSGLQLLLREQVDVLVYVTAAHLAPGSGSSQARGAAAVLRENASAISFAFAGCHLPTRNALRAAWATRAGLLWHYGRDVRRGTSVVAVSQSLTKLDGRISALLARRFGMDKNLVQQQLEADTAGVRHALDSIGRADPSWPAAAQLAADATDQTAMSWAVALSRSEHLPGSPDGGPATVRAELTSLLARPVGALVWAAQATLAPPRSTQALGSGAALLADSSRQVWAGGGTGPAASGGGVDPSIWQGMDQRLVDLTAAFVDRRPTEEEQPLFRALSAAQDQLAIAFSQAHPGTSAAAVKATLEGPTHAMLVAIHDTVVHKSTAAWDIAASEDGFAGLAAVLAKALTGVNSGLPAG